MLYKPGPRLIRPLKCSTIRYAVLIFPVIKALLIDAIAGIRSTCGTGRSCLAPGASSIDTAEGSADSVPTVRVDVYHNLRQVKPGNQRQGD